MRHGVVRLVVDVVFVPVAAAVAIFQRISLPRAGAAESPRIVWGSTPLINNSYWARSMAQAGFRSESFVTHVYAANAREDFDRVLTDEYGRAAALVKPYLAFLSCLRRYDVVVTSCNGLFLAGPISSRIQAGLLRLAGKKIVMIPFGSDAFVYRRVRSTSLLQGLLLSYPQMARQQRRIERNLDYWCERADVVIAGYMGPDGFGRWDVILGSVLFVELDRWRPTTSYSHHDGRSGTVRICHAPNHRGLKGTEFVIDSVRQLRDEGLDVELVLLEGMPNREVVEVLCGKVDILVENMVMIAHGLNAIEGMAAGLPTLCNMSDEQYLLPFRRYSFLGECPLVSAEPETLTSVLRELVTRPALREELGRLGRSYVEKYHGFDSSRHLFAAVLDFLYGRRATLSDLYHPLTSDYVRREPHIVPPLDKNRLRA